MHTFGSDPELMLEKNGYYYSAIGIVLGTKDKRLVKNGNEFYYDNVLAECSIKPASSKEEAVENIRHALQTYASLVKPYKIVCQASQEYPQDQLRHKDALEIGCTPEHCAYTLKSYQPDDNIFHKTRLRSAGGHIHIGSKFAQAGQLNCYRLIRMMDLFVGIPSVFLDKDPTSKTRKKLYGLAGRFRRPNHGVEYRSMGNFWLNSPKLVELIYDLVEFTVNFVESDSDKKLWEIDEVALANDDNWNKSSFNPVKCHKCNAYDPKELQKAITSMDETSAAKLMDIAVKYLPPSLTKTIQKCSVKQSDLYSEWGL